MRNLWVWGQGGQLPPQGIKMQTVQLISTFQQNDFHNGLQSFNDGYLQDNIVDYDSRAQATLTG